MGKIIFYHLFFGDEGNWVASGPVAATSNTQIVEVIVITAMVILATIAVFVAVTRTPKPVPVPRSVTNSGNSQD